MKPLMTSEGALLFSFGECPDVWTLHAITASVANRDRLDVRVSRQNSSALPRMVPICELDGWTVP